MGFKKGQEDRPTPPEVYGWRMWVMGLGTAFGGTVFGYESSFIGGTLGLTSTGTAFGFLGNDICAAQKQLITSNITSVFHLGCFGGALFGFPFAEKFGRRPAMLFATTLATVGAVSTTIAHDESTLGLLYAGRVIVGLGTGLITLTSPLYLAEISPPAIRGILIGAYEIAYQVAAVVGFFIAYAVAVTQPTWADAAETVPNVTQFRIPFGLQFIFITVSLIFSIFMIESPRWLIKSGNFEEAEKAQVWLNNLPRDHPYVRGILTAAYDQNERLTFQAHKGGRFGTLKELLRPGIRNRVALAIGIMVFQNLTGANAINYYAPTFFKSVGMRGNNALLMTGVFGVVKMVASVIFLVFLVDRIGRRIPLMFASVWIIGTMLYIGIYIAVAHPTADSDPTAAGRAGVAMLFIYAVAFCMSWSGIAWIICAEIWPNHVRALCNSIAVQTQWLMQFAITRATPYMLAEDSLSWGTYIFYAAWMALAIPAVYFFCPETKGVPLEKMDEIFGLEHTDDPEAKAEVQHRENAKESPDTEADKVKEVR